MNTETNKELLETHIKPIHSIYRDEPFWILELDGTLVYSNNALKFNITEISFFSKQDNRLTDYSELFHDLYSNYDQSSVPEEVIAIWQNTSETTCYLFEISYLVVNNQPIGILITNQGNVANFEYASLLNHICFDGKRKNLNIELSARELEIVYFLIRGKTYEEISEILSDLYQKPISSSSIGKIIRGSLYDKFNVWNKFELKQLLMRSNFVNKIPLIIYQNILKR